eukprot:COSAG05_NODE_5318_length_1208_cov_2.345356_1_plen_47_part_10
MSLSLQTYLPKVKVGLREKENSVDSGRGEFEMPHETCKRQNQELKTK